MIYRLLVSLALGTGLAAASGPLLAQSDDDRSQPVDSVTKPLGADDKAGDKSGDKTADPTKSLGGGNAGSRNVSFGALDINMDNKLSRDEIKADNRLTADFDKIDKDRNGSLSDAEFAAFEKDGKDDKNKAEDKGKSARDKAKDKGKAAKEDVKDESDRAKDKVD